MAIKQSIPDVGDDLDSHTRVLKAIKEAVELGQGTSRDFLRSFLTLERASELGLLDALNNGSFNKVPRHFDIILNSPWINYALDTSFNKAGFYKDALGRVFLRGLISSGTSATAIATLPAGFRPQNACLFGCYSVISGSAKIARVDIRADGVIVFQESGTPDYLTLDGLSFAVFQ